MVDYLPRSAWNARPPDGGPGSLTVSRVKGAVIHWPGTSSQKPIHTKDAVAAALRSWQNYHMDVKGWSDIAYQVAVDQLGRAWTLRGLRTQSGANGNAELNEDYGAILLILIAGEQPSAAMNATVRGVITDFRKIYPNGTAIRPHSAVRPDGTDCPGPAARAAIARGDFTPRTITTEDEMTPEQEKKILDYLAAVSVQIQANTRQHVQAAVQLMKSEIDEVDDEVWNRQIADVSTPETDTAAAATLLTHAANRAAQQAVELLQPQLDDILQRLQRIEDDTDDGTAEAPKA